MRYTYITTVSEGYMFALNCNFNTNKFYGTNADFHVLHNGTITEDYMKRCNDSFPFKIVWLNMLDYGTSFHNAKYGLARSIDYDSICLIDSDLFICCDTKEYFDKVYGNKLLISAGHMWAGGRKEYLDWGNPDVVIDRCKAQIADFPIFVDPSWLREFFKYWYENTTDKYVDISKEPSHPLVAFNRSICKFLTQDQVEALDGNLWVFDMRYWQDTVSIRDSKMFNQNGERICAVHNKWWKEGRSSAEWLAHRSVIANPEPWLVDNLNRGQHNFNTIRDFMAVFNDMTPATRRDDYFSGRMEWHPYLTKWIKEYNEGKIRV